MYSTPSFLVEMLYCVSYIFIYFYFYIENKLIDIIINITQQQNKDNFHRKQKGRWVYDSDNPIKNKKPNF